MKTFYQLLLTIACFGAFSVRSAGETLDSAEDNAGVAINQTDALIYPFAMTVSGILKGEARVVISVDAQGKLNDALVVGYTDPVFAQAAVGALKRWSYEPARVRGVARASRAHVLFVFKNDMGVMVQSLPGMIDANIMRNHNDRYAYTAYQLRELDHIPVPSHVVPPDPSKAGLRGGKRTVTVEFYIDEEGRVRLPAVSRDEPDDAFAAAAVSAVEQWRFEPPVRKGRPVLVLAKQDFSFVPKS